MVAGSFQVLIYDQNTQQRINKISEEGVGASLNIDSEAMFTAMFTILHIISRKCFYSVNDTECTSFK